MAAITENYQLKWHSFGSHMYSCVASSLCNSNFTDVCLSTFDGHQILAHRFILSACSQYLHQLLKIQSKVNTTLPLFIILPPEISYKTMKVLIHYMYTGETTVSKDILDKVLRGGDLLKIIGLWKPSDKEDALDRSKNQIEKKIVEPKLPVPKLVHFENKTSSVIPTSPSNYNYKNNEQNKKPQTPPLKSAELNKESCKKAKLLSKDIPQTRTIISEPKTTASIKVKESSKISSGNLEYMVIKEEPIEWNEIQDSDLEMVEGTQFFDSEMTIKPEIIVDDSQDAETSTTEELYTPLTCELCAESFAHPADWVKHIQTHTDMLPAKRQRRGRSGMEEENKSFPPLHCDLCREYFPTPAEWVRHIEDCHTEFELRISNSSDGKQVKVKPLQDFQKVCINCNKKFPSHASMLIHKRTHTGEKPFMCEFCHKGFNVKSNLLRHLRTLHDKILNSTDIEEKDNVTVDVEHVFKDVKKNSENS